MPDTSLTPREILARLDEYVVGQAKAKRAVAVALRNRWRRRQLDADLAADVYPKNILLIGPTGVGKTEIARRLAGLARAPFVKVEASKYSEVGYHGRDVESMVRDLVDAAIALVRRERVEEIRPKARDHAERRILDALLYAKGLLDPVRPPSLSTSGWQPEGTPQGGLEGAVDLNEHAQRQQQVEQLADDLRNSKLEDDLVEVEVLDKRPSTLNIQGPQGTETMGIDASALQELWGRSPARKTKMRKVSVREARDLFTEEEADKLLDEDAVVRDALDRAENDGIIFLDEVDKIIGGNASGGPEVSREGVQRDLLPIVEGCAVFTRYGHVRSDHMLFIAAGAFHFHKPSELIPELQGRFPVRVALQPLEEVDFVRILTEPRNSLTKQYEALFGTEDVRLRYTEDGVKRIAELAFRANHTSQNIGARRLFTIMEKCLEELSFEAPERKGSEIVIDRAAVDEALGETGDDEELIPYQL